jgi:BirA family biotin operon repressor/biotin-[acetyl-CoA-carboxylase] ligase
VAVREFFAKYLEDGQGDPTHEKKTPDSLIIKKSLSEKKTLTKIKWPNDLYYQDRKAGGILIENIVTGNIDGSYGSMNNSQQAWQWAIIGIGININQIHFPQGLSNPISLKQITGQHFDIINLAKELCGIINTWFEKLITEGFNNIYAQYLTHLYKKNETVRLKKESRVFEAVIKTVSPAGHLITEHGIEEEFGFGEVEWVKEVR